MRRRSTPPRRSAAARRRRRRHVVRLRQHLAVESLDDAARAEADGRFALFQGAVDIGQGSNTVIPQICADALGAPIAQFDLVGDTDTTPDCGKTSASRQTFVSGNAAALAGRAMRRAILRLANAGEDATLDFEDGARVIGRGGERRVDLERAAGQFQAGFVVEVRERSIRRPRRSTPTARASPTPCSARARISPRSRSISSSAA
jgi:CO/xanthine dehydrogenase Mo-binding subunit